MSVRKWKMVEVYYRRYSAPKGDRMRVQLWSFGKVVDWTAEGIALNCKGGENADEVIFIPWQRIAHVWLDSDFEGNQDVRDGYE